MHSFKLWVGSNTKKGGYTRGYTALQEDHHTKQGKEGFNPSNHFTVTC